MSDIDINVVRDAARVVKRAMWDGAEARRAMNEIGISVTPANFYSIVPTMDDLDDSFEYGEDAPFNDARVFDPKVMAGFLTDTLMPHSEDFDPPEYGEDPPAGFYWGNPAFSFSDAMSYYCVLRAQRPRTVIEVGSGYSTLIAREALASNGGGRLICVEPYPMEWLRDLDGVELHETRVQDLPAGWFNDRLDDGDVLFIDSTHVVKSGSDCAHLYLRVLPSLIHHLMVHVHDIYLPFAMPKPKILKNNIYWNEGYVLMALLQGNPDFRVMYGSYYHWQFNREALTKFMHGRWRPGGASMWIMHGR